MGWFEEQIKLREENDEQMLKDSFVQIADAVTGENLAKKRNRKKAEGNENAIEEILRFYGEKAGKTPEQMDNWDDWLEYVLRPYGIMKREIALSKGGIEMQPVR